MAIKVLKETELTNTIAIVVGTRPGIIKLSPVIRALEKKGVNYFIVHTGQHYSYNMDKQFFEELELPEPQYKNDVVKKATLHGGQTAEMIKGLEKAFLEAKPKIVVVGGDANTNLAGALAARKLGLRVAHVEAGLRSDDWRMPEEHNRVMIDHISEYLFPPTEKAKQNLIEDNVKGKIEITGNTIVDAVYQNLKLANKKSQILDVLNLSPREYFLVTSHREENVDSKATLEEIIESLHVVHNRYDLPVVFPIHPRTRKRLQEFDLEKKAKLIRGLKLIEPLGYLDFLRLLAEAKLVLTDSGGIQEEACILRVPCVTLRENTERPETVDVGANLVAGTTPDKIVAAVKQMLSRERRWVNPFGDGRARERIADFLNERLCS